MQPKDKDSEGIVAEIKSGIGSPFWRALRSICEDDLRNLDKSILENDNLTLQQREELRKRRSYLKYFIDLPERTINRLSGDSSGVPELDPYPKTLDEALNK